MAAGLSLGSIISKVIKSWLSSAGNITCGKGSSPTLLCAQPLILPEEGGPDGYSKSVLVRRSKYQSGGIPIGWKAFDL